MGIGGCGSKPYGHILDGRHVRMENMKAIPWFLHCKACKGLDSVEVRWGRIWELVGKECDREDYWRNRWMSWQGSAVKSAVSYCWFINTRLNTAIDSKWNAHVNHAHNMHHNVTCVKIPHALNYRPTSHILELSHWSTWLTNCAWRDPLYLWKMPRRRQLI